MMIDVLGDDGVEFCPLWTSGMVLSSTSLSMMVYNFMHLPGATVRVRGLGDGRPEMSVRLHARLRVVVRALLGEARVE